MDTDIGLWHIATRRNFSGQRKDFYTVTDSYGDCHIYHNPFGQDDEAIEFIVEGIARAFVDSDFEGVAMNGELEVGGEYPNFYIQGVIA